MNETKIIIITKENNNLQVTLCNLVKMYCCEWSGYNLIDVDENGIYSFEKYVPSFWLDTDKKAFLLSYNNKWAGFALIDKDFKIHIDYDYAMSEFFIMPKYRRLGLGKYLAVSLFDMYKGKWEVGRNPKNKQSVSFWDKTLKEYTNNNFEVIYSTPKHEYSDGTLGDILSFNNK